MSQSNEQVLKTIQGLGLSRLDSQVYIYLSKKGSQKGSEITKGLKVQKQPLYRSLKNLQNKGIVSVTLEHPARFSAVSFDKVVDLFVKGKMAEAQRIQESKNDLLASWQAISVGESPDSSARFTVIEGRGYIYAKIIQMLKGTKNYFSTISTVRNLLRADQFGVMDSINDCTQSIRYRILTEFSKQEMNTLQQLLNTIKMTKVQFEARTPELGMNLFPEMVIRDDEEAVFFISPMTDASASQQTDACLWTNCKSLVQAMTAVFEEIWHNSTQVQSKINEIQTGKSTQKTYLLPDKEIAYKKYAEAVNSASKEIMILTTSQAITELAKQKHLVESWSSKHVSVRIMAPLIWDNLEAVKQLQQSCKIKHVPIGYLATTIIDNQELFQFKNPPSEEKRNDQIGFDSVIYSNDFEYVEKTQKMLDYIWINAQLSASTDLETATNPLISPAGILPENYPTRKILGSKVVDIKNLKEEEVVNKIIQGKKFKVKDVTKDVNRLYGTGGSVIIHPPPCLNLPDLMLEFMHVEKQSSLGASDMLTVYEFIKTDIGTGYAPVGWLMSNKTAFSFAKKMLGNSPLANNMNLAKEEEINIHVHGNRLFVGWTVPITLHLGNIVLPPACLILESYGNLHSVGYTSLTGRFNAVKTVIEKNFYEAFVTFMHPQSMYSGPGTDGFLCRDYIATMYPASSNQP